MLPSLRADPRIQLAAAAAPRASSRDAFAAEFGGAVYPDVAALCADPNVEAVYVATPHQLHTEHVITALQAGKHVLVDKPLAVTLPDAKRMVDAAKQADRHLIVGPSHSFDPPVMRAREMIASGQYGALRMIQALNYTDFLYRPRRPEELRTKDGGGVIFSQAIHQIDIVRLLAGGEATHVSAMTGAWDAARPTEGAFAALLGFRSGAFATLSYSGYGHFDSDEWMGGIGELGQTKAPDAVGKARRTLASVAADDEIRLKTNRTFGAANAPPQAVQNEHFGPVIALCDKADLRLAPDGVHIYRAEGQSFTLVPLNPVPRKPVLDALFAAVRHDSPPAQTGAWGLASLEVCHAILRSAEEGCNVALTHQVAVNEGKST
jgi:phthalate 4,5-cis-dihydrodiol dehydrogenase